MRALGSFAALWETVTVEAEAVERKLLEELAVVMVQSGDELGLVTRLDVLDNLASIGARAIAIRDEADPAEETLVRALNELPDSLLDEPVDAIAIEIGAAARGHGVMIVLDSFNDALDNYFAALE